MSPEPASYDPEEFVHGSQPWPRLLALKDGELLAKGEVFEHQTAVRPKPAKHGSEPEPKQVQHGHQVIAERLCRLPCEVVDFTAGQDCDEGQYHEASGSADADVVNVVHCRILPVEQVDDVPGDIVADGQRRQGRADCNNNGSHPCYGLRGHGTHRKSLKNDSTSSLPVMQELSIAYRSPIYDLTAIGDWSHRSTVRRCGISPE